MFRTQTPQALSCLLHTSACALNTKAVRAGLTPATVVMCLSSDESNFSNIFSVPVLWQGLVPQGKI